MKDWIVTNQALALSPPLVNDPLRRSPNALMEVINQFKVKTSARYAPGVIKGKPVTWCNVYLSDVTAALGCPVPRQMNGKWLRANRQIEWLRGEPNGWKVSNEKDAVLSALMGSVAVAAWHSKTLAAGHVAILIPRPSPTVSQAGRTLGVMPLANAFGTSLLPALEFFTHQ